MKKITLILIVSFFAFYSCNTPKQRANKALELSIKGEYTKSVLDYFFDHKDLFTEEPYVERYIKEYGAEASRKATEAAEVLINIPNLIDAYKFIKLVESKPIKIIDAVSLVWQYGSHGKEAIHTDMLKFTKDYYVHDKKGIIDSSRQIVIYTKQENAPTVSLYYILIKQGEKQRYRIDMIKLDGQWKIYYCFPE